MFKIFKYFIFIFLVVLFSYFVFSAAKAEYSLFDPTSDPSLDLKTSLENIINNDIIFDEKSNPIVLYQYKTHAVAAHLDEIISLRTSNSQTFSLGQNQYRTKIYSGAQFYFENDIWYQTETATTSVEAWNEQIKTTLIEKIINYFSVAVLYAEVFFAGGGDGQLQHYNAGNETWSSMRAGPGTNANYADDEQKVAATAAGTNSFNTLNRLRFPFDTSSIDDGATINSASLFLVGASKANGAGLSDTNGGITIVESTAASFTELVNGDFVEVGTVSFGSVLNSEITADASTYTEVELNASGLEFVSDNSFTDLMVIYTADMSDTDPGTLMGSSYIYFFMSEKTGTSYDPYLDIDWEAPAPPASPVATSTPGYGLNYLEFAFILLLFIAFFLLIASTGTALNNWFRNLWRF